MALIRLTAFLASVLRLKAAAPDQVLYAALREGKRGYRSWASAGELLPHRHRQARCHELQRGLHHRPITACQTV